MLRPKVLFFVGIAVLLSGTGCRSTKLASRPLTAEEQQWQDVIERNYSAWEKPYLSPLQESPDIPAATQDWEPTPVNPFPATEGAGLSRLPEPPMEIQLMPIAQDADDYTKELQQYTVKKNDTLAVIARQFYGNAGEWRRIYEANRDILSSPDRLQPGMTLTIPETGTSN